MVIRTVAIVGVGLIGGSWGLALRAHGFRGRILGVSSSRTLQAALDRQAIDEGATLDEAIPKADLVILSQPIHRILEALPRVAALAGKEALVTDVGSTKAAIGDAAKKLFSARPWFIGGHPMAGKEKRGVEQAEPNLFHRATYVLTPPEGSLPDVPIVNEFRNWIEKIGAHVLVLCPKTHDQVVTWTSHLPQLVSSSLAACVSAQVDSEDHQAVAGPGLRDMTRLAESSFEIWQDIFETNRENLEQALQLYIQRLEDLKQNLFAPRLRQEFEQAQHLSKKPSRRSK